jgi:hypothetical protein
MFSNREDMMANLWLRAAVACVGLLLAGACAQTPGRDDKAQSDAIPKAPAYLE